MKLRNPFGKKTVADDANKALGDNIRAGLRAAAEEPQPVTKACKKCGGLFLAHRLANVPTVTVNVGAEGDVISITTRKERYCVGCRPSADIVFAIQGGAGDDSPQDTRHFRVCDLYFQEVDANSGEDIYSASIEEYNHIFCGECGDMSEWALCAACTAQSMAPPKAKKTTARS